MLDPRSPGPFRTVPLWPLTPDRLCACGRDSCNAPGKHPRWRQDPLPDGGYGVICGSGPDGSDLFVVDLDTKPDKGINGLEEFRNLHLSHTGQDFPDTLVVGTGSGGFHFYFRHPGWAVKNSTSKLAKGIDIKGDGGWVVGPGSPHRSGRPYVVLHSAPVAEAPGWLLDWPGLRRDSDAIELSRGLPVNTLQDMDSPEAIANKEAFRAECAGEIGNLRPAVEGDRGHDALFHAAKRGTCYYLLPPEVAEDIIWEWYNPRCVPPWPPEKRSEVVRKVHEAIRTNNEITPGPAPSDWADNLVKRAILGTDSDPDEIIALREHNPDHRYSIVLGDCIANGKLVTRSISELTFRLRRSPDWTGVLRYDTFADRIRAVDPPVRLDAEKSSLSDNDITSVRVWFEVAADTTAQPEAIRAAVYGAAFAAPVHPVRDYLTNLPNHDPKRVLPPLAMQWFGAAELLDVELLTRFLVGAARRILFPGTLMAKLDNMLVLQGNQNYGKSSWIKALFRREWVSEQIADLHDKDSSQGIAKGVWAQEIAELDKLLKADPSTTKDYLSREVDRFRPAYGRELVEVPRQACFIGNTNEDFFLRDLTGERRFWPLRVVKPINCAAVEANRDEVWGAVMSLVRDSTYRHWVDPTMDEGLRLALEARHAMFTVQDAWTESTAVYDYCAGRAYVNTFDLFRWVVCNGAPDALAKFTRKEQLRVAEILRRMGGAPTTIRKDGHVIRAYRMPENIATSTPSTNEIKRRAMVEGLTAVPQDPQTGKATAHNGSH